MNLMFLNSIARNTYGGVESWMVRVASEMSRRSHKVVAVGRRGSVFLEYMRHTGSRPVEIYEVKIGGDFNPFTIYRLSGVIKKNAVDFVFVSCNKDLRLGGLAARYSGRTKIVWRIGVDLTRNNWVHRKLTPKLLDGVIAPSSNLKEHITRYGYLSDDLVTVIASATEAFTKRWERDEARRNLRNKYGLSQGSIVAVTSGRFVPEKGHHFLVAAALEIVKVRPEIFFLLLGNGPRESFLKKQVSTLQLDRHFIFPGFLSDFELELTGADLMIHPATEEAFGNALLDGMQAALPVITTNVGGIPEVVEDNRTSVLVPAGDVPGLARAVIELLGDRDKMRRLGEAGYQRWREKYTMEIMIDRLEKYLAKLAVE